MKIKRGVRVRLVKDSCGDLPKSLMGRTGTVARRAPSFDELGLKAYMVSFPSRSKERQLWEDELVVVDN